MKLTESDYISAAKELNCEVAAIKAIAEVESAGSGFLPEPYQALPKILFEGHIFHRQTNGRYSKNPKYSDISHPNWTKEHYEGGILEWERFKAAAELDLQAAIASTSWGKFQIMGFNYGLCGYEDVFAFHRDMHISEAHHLRAFLNYCKSRKLIDEIQRKDWAGFAYGYNGPGYAKNKYDIKMEKAYLRYKRQK